MKTLFVFTPTSKEAREVLEHFGFDKHLGSGLAVPYEGADQLWNLLDQSGGGFICETVLIKEA